MQEWFAFYPDCDSENLKNTYRSVFQHSQYTPCTQHDRFEIEKLVTI